ncbi:MAG: AAA family ATPase [Candidatus Pacebacteria bacterium]|nr:AAA family ATPase [Candidatus Paceibacterota bacterium]
MIQRLVVQNYKRFDALNFALNKELNIIVGDNESGKSTILECVNLALNFKINGRFAQSELNSFLFNKKVVDDYVTAVKEDQNAELPEILIELYFDDVPDLATLKGSMNSRKENLPGVKVSIKFDENYRTEYQTFVSENPAQIKTIPIEYYQASWFSFADEAITTRGMPLSSTMLDATTIRLQNGTDSYIKSVINESLDGKQKAQLSLAFRNLKEIFLEDDSIGTINLALGTKKGDITEKELEVSLDVSQKSGWDSHLIPYLDKIPFHLTGMGEQSSLKLLLTLSREVDDCQIVLIEEIENHLSFSTMARLLKRIKDKCEGKQVIITTHSTYVLNKLGIDSLILIGLQNQVAKLAELTAGTREYFEKLPGYDTLRMILAKKAILVEGASDELIVQRAYLDTYGNLPIEDGTDVISVRGLSFKRFLDIATLLGTKVVVVTDNDGDYDRKITAKYSDYAPHANITISASTDNDLPTLESHLVALNDTAQLNAILGREGGVKDTLLAFMLDSDNKADDALKIFNSTTTIVFPDYVTRAIQKEE